MKYSIYLLFIFISFNIFAKIEGGNEVGNGGDRYRFAYAFFYYDNLAKVKSLNIEHCFPKPGKLEIENPYMFNVSYPQIEKCLIKFSENTEVFNFLKYFKKFQAKILNYKNRNQKVKELVSELESMKSALQQIFLYKSYEDFRFDEVCYNKVKFRLKYLQSNFKDSYVNEVEFISLPNEDLIYVDFKKVSTLNYYLLTGLVFHEILRKYKSFNYDEDYLYSVSLFNSYFPNFYFDILKER